MAKYVPDIKTQRWVIIAPTRTKRPQDVAAGQPKPAHVCPFCTGNESLTPPEVYRIGEGAADQPGWSVRVVPNKFPITDIHEVIIHSTSDTDDIETLPVDQVTRIVTAYRNRYRVNQQLGQVMIFCNHGIGAGASLKHPHSQLVVVPNQINMDAVSMEPINNIVYDNTNFITYCPDFSQWPLELWIAPKVHGKRFSDVTDAELPDFAAVMQDGLKRIKSVLASPTGLFHQDDAFIYNYYIYHGENWFLRIIPRAVYRAGFELGTGLSVNVLDPTQASELLKAASV